MRIGALSETNTSDLHQGWRWATIPEVTSENGLFADGDWIESKDQDPDGDVRLVQLADIGDGSYRNRSSRFLTSNKAAELGCTFLKPGDVLIARMPDPLGRACIFPGDAKPCVTAVDVCIVRAEPKAVEQKWLMHAINAPQFRVAVAALQSGSTRKRISRSNLGTLHLPIPPIHEQQCIVAEIEKQFTRLGAGVAALRRLQANLKRYRAAVLKAACEGRLVPTEAELARREGRSYESGEQLLQRLRKEVTSSPGRITSCAASDVPEGWIAVPLEELSLSIRNGISTKPDADAGIPILRISAVRPFALKLDDVRYLSQAESDYALYSLQRGDLLFTRYNGSRSLVGVCAIVPNLPTFVVYPDKLIRVRIASPLVPTFIAIAANVGMARNHLESRIRTTAGQSGISGGDLKQMPIPVPPLAEQQRIVAEVERRLSVVEELEATVAANLQRAARLRQAVLQRAFTGRLVKAELPTA